LAVDESAVSGERTAEFIRRVDLDAGLIGIDLQHPPARWIADPNRGGSRTIGSQDEAVIVSQAVEQLRIGLSDPGTQ
jgi:hypothetical protein